MCVYPYCPDQTVANNTGYLAEHALVAVNTDNIGRFKWVPQMGYIPAVVGDYDEDGLYDSISFSGWLVTTGFKNPPPGNNSLYIEFSATNPTSFASCSLQGGSGPLNCPKCEYGLCDEGNPFEDYTFFQNATGKISGDGLSLLDPSLPGTECIINIFKLPLPQLGINGGNAKNFKLGFSVWFNCDGGLEAGDNELHIGDINIDIKPCPYDDPYFIDGPLLGPVPDSGDE